MKVVRRDPDTGYIDRSFWVPKKYIPVEATKAALTFSTMTERTQRFLTLWRETDHHLLIPREFWKPETQDYKVVDCRPLSYPKTSVKSRIQLDFKSNFRETVQRDAVKVMQESRGGILQLACGKGKTICALELIAREGVPSLIIVDNTHLLEQWLNEIGRHLEVPGGVGIIGAGKFDWQKEVVIGTYHTIANMAEEMPEEVVRWFGLVIWDEAHHMAAPTWMKAADLFPCKRIGLTATPERADGMHVVYDFHLGEILFKDLTQELKPQIFFQWTGLEVDVTDPKTKEQVCDVNGELHTSMLAGYFGQWLPRIDFILNEVKQAALAGRKILVLSYSVAELVNMYEIWNHGKDLYTNIPEPTPQDVGETELPIPLDDSTERRLHKKLDELDKALADPGFPVAQKAGLRQHRSEILTRFVQARVFKKVANERDKRQRLYVRQALERNATGSAGLMIGEIKARERMKMLSEKQVTFSIMKYGREGLDEQSLDTVFVCEPMSQKNSLQQLMGRVLRIKLGKKQPIVMFFEDNIGPMIGMCTKLRKHLNSWPLEEGGPFSYTLVGHPRKGRGRTSWGTVT